ncbi:lipopolysaccharide biosynthesis protein [Desulfobacula toluolica]|uniref:Polysaccharide biosynthesis protein n=1 Tax=Desulfobacula toluolica (strain DSM 7467 / Tol2) TaxID=651182 RepID=K0NS69_DESTT|nr:oligosaccharide flippase family protein [Desulfobacula toluolica]CCK81827.1 polysaccharide biosynthesis protein [Desulfobacula toluolica Tol2]
MYNKIKKTTSAVKYTLIFKTLSQCCGLIATVLLVRALSEFDYGVYNLLYSVIGLIGTVLSLGIGDALLRYMPEYYNRGEFKIAHNLFKISCVIRMVADVAILGFILLLWQQIAPFLKITEYKSYFMLFTLIIVLHQQRNFLEIVLSSYFLHKYSKPIALLFAIIKAIGYGFIIIYDKNLWHAIIIDLSAYLISFALLQILYYNKIPFSSGTIDSITSNEKKRVGKYALFYNFNNTGVGVLSANFDNFIIVMLLNPVAVGAYSFYVQINLQISSLLPLIYLRDVIKPAFFAIGTSLSQKDKLTQFFQSLVKINLFFAVPCCCFLFIFGDYISSIISNNKFVEYSSILCVMFFFSILNSLPIATVAQLMEKADIVLYSKIFAVYNIVADLILIKFFGIWGAVFATGTATLSKNIFIWYFVRKEASFKGLELFMIKISLFWAAISVFIYSLSKIIPSNITYQLLFGVSIFAIAFFIQFGCNYFRPDEKQIFKTVSDGNSKWIFLFKLLKMLPG